MSRSQMLRCSNFCCDLCTAFVIISSQFVTEYRVDAYSIPWWNFTFDSHMSMTMTGDDETRRDTRCDLSFRRMSHVIHSLNCGCFLCHCSACLHQVVVRTAYADFRLW